ncbi:MAG: inositol monophosphatase family protein [Pseudomonadota bacterium]
MDLHDDLLRVAHLAADAADAETLKWFRSTHLKADNKLDAGFDPVTQADRAAERAMRTVLQRERPDDAILGEEDGYTDGTSGLTWVLDPIDGTRGYLCGTPTWGTLIAVGPDTGPTVGLIAQPFTDERFTGRPGHAQWTWRGDTRDISVRGTTDLDQALIFSTFPEVGTPAEAAAFHAVAGQCLLTRYGTDCYAHGLLAAGQIDLVIEAGLALVDCLKFNLLGESIRGSNSDARSIGPATNWGK